jgi:lipid-binding SYLF domain-containing protein
VCRSEGGRGAWGAPLMIGISGGSLGLQIGGQAADYVFLVMNPKGIDYLLRSQFTLGADAAVAAGPLGRTGEAGTDLRMRAEILAYSRTRGLFAGISLEGAVVKQDKDANESLYGERLDPKALLREGRVLIPEPARGLVELLQSASPQRRPGD